MKSMVFESKMFGVTDNRYKKRGSEPCLPLEIEVPDSLNEQSISLFMLHSCEKDNPLTRPQLISLIQLLTIADSFGHDINLMLTRATASNWKQVVYDNHLKPKENPSA